jgi:predicted nucleic acid-binding protein
MGEGSPPMSVDGALADTSLLIGWEQQRFSSHDMPKTLAVSAVTIGELKLGVLTATDPHTRAARLRTLGDARRRLRRHPRLARGQAVNPTAMRTTG